MIKKGLLISVSCLFLAACSAGKAEEDVEQKQEQIQVQQEESKEEQLQADNFPVTVEIGGKFVTIEEKPERILPLSLDGAEIVLDLVGTERVLAISKSVENPMISAQAEHANNIQERIASATNIDPEQILSYETDLLLLTKMHGQEADADQLLQQAGVPILSFDTVKTVEDLFHNYELIGTAVGEQKKAETIVQSMKDEIQSIRKTIPQDVEAPTVLVLSEVGPGTGPYMLGPTNISYDLIKLAGGKPAVDVIELDRTTKAEVEQVIKMNPNYLFLLDWQGNGEQAYQELMDAPGWNTLKAVQDGNVKVMEVKYLMNPNREIVHGLKVLTETIHGGTE